MISYVVDRDGQFSEARRTAGYEQACRVMPELEKPSDPQEPVRLGVRGQSGEAGGEAAVGCRPLRADAKK